MTAAVGRPPRVARWLAAGALLCAVAACGDTATPTGVATNPPGQGVTGTSGATGSPSSGAGVRTVLSPLGLNIHSDPQLSSPHLGTAAQGAVLNVLDHTDQNGGWYRVQGQTVTGWITADPTLTAAGQFQSFSSSDAGFSVLYPQDWTFAQEPADTLFHPISGPQSLVVRSGESVAAFATGGPGYAGAGQQTVVVCGVTADLDLYKRSAGASASAVPGTAAPLALLAQVRLRLDATHALALDYNYSAAADLAVFSDVYNSMTFPFPQCQAPAPSAPPASPAPT